MYEKSLAVSALDEHLVRFVGEADQKVCFATLQKTFCNDTLSPRQLKKRVARLIYAGRLAYEYAYGSSYIGLAYGSPRKISDRIWLSPPKMSTEMEAGEVTLCLHRGTSFGLGDHPTTCMALQLIDELLGKTRIKRALDIGTGTGVLALALARLGNCSVDAVDTDQCAVAETRLNVKANQLEDRVSVSQTELKALEGGYGLVVANLRTPTLIHLSKDISHRLTPTSFLVFSGMRADEVEPVCRQYAVFGFSMEKKMLEKRWAGLWLSRAAT